MKLYRIWGGNIYRPDGAFRCVVSAMTKKRAVEMINEVNGSEVSQYYFNSFFQETVNEVEIQVATQDGVQEGLWLYYPGPLKVENFRKVI